MKDEPYHKIALSFDLNVIGRDLRDGTGAVNGLLSRYKMKQQQTTHTHIKKKKTHMALCHVIKSELGE